MPKKGTVAGQGGGVDQTSQRHLNTFTDKETVPTMRLRGAAREDGQDGGTNYRELDTVESQQCQELDGAVTLNVTIFKDCRVFLG